MCWFRPNNAAKQRSGDTSVRIPNFSISLKWFYCHWVNHVIGWSSNKSRDKETMPMSVQIRSVTLQKETVSSCETLVPLPKFQYENWEDLISRMYKFSC